MVRLVNVPILDRATGTLGGELEGHRLRSPVTSAEMFKVPADVIHVLRQHLSEGAQVWSYYTTQFLAGYHGYAVVVGDHVVGYNILAVS